MDDRRREILDAALEIFLERGFDSATIAAIRDRSGASIGSIYHFFGGKADMAAALLTMATSGWALQAEQEPAANGAEASITSSVASFLRWGRQNPMLFSFMDDLLARSKFTGDFRALGEMVTAGRETAAALYRDWATAGLVRNLPWDVAYALIMGPAYALMRNSGERQINDREIDEIVRAAWYSVSPDHLRATAADSRPNT